MTISIGTANASSTRDTQVAWLRRREDSRTAQAPRPERPRELSAAR